MTKIELIIASVVREDRIFELLIPIPKSKGHF